MLAKEMLKKYKHDLIGKVINTCPMGKYPGGKATIIELKPDKKAAPEIVFQIRHESFGEIGVFEYEEVSFYII